VTFVEGVPVVGVEVTAAGEVGAGGAPSLVLTDMPTTNADHNTRPTSNRFSVRISSMLGPPSPFERRAIAEIRHRCDLRIMGVADPKP
jgi:hypothetical protein